MTTRELLVLAGDAVGMILMIAAIWFLMAVLPAQFSAESDWLRDDAATAPKIVMGRK